MAYDYPLTYQPVKPTIIPAAGGGSLVLPDFAGMYASYEDSKVGRQLKREEDRQKKLDNELKNKELEMRKQLSDQDFQLGKLKLEEAKSILEERKNKEVMDRKLKIRDGIIKIATSGRLSAESRKNIVDEYNGKLTKEESMFAIGPGDVEIKVDEKDPLAKYTRIAQTLPDEEYNKMGITVTPNKYNPETGMIEDEKELKLRAAKLANFSELNKQGQGQQFADALYNRELAKERANATVSLLKTPVEKYTKEYDEAASNYQSSSDFTDLLDNNISKYGEDFLSKENLFNQYVADISSFFGIDNETRTKINDASSLFKQLEVQMLKNNKGLLSPMSEQDRKFLTSSMGEMTDDTKKVKFLFDYVKSRNLRDMIGKEYVKNKYVTDWNNKADKLTTHESDEFMKGLNKLKLIDSKGDSFAKYYKEMSVEGFTPNEILDGWKKRTN